MNQDNISNEGQADIHQRAIAERLQTELSDHSQEVIIQDLKTDLLKFCLLGINGLVFCILLELRQYLYYTLSVPFIPPILLELISSFIYLKTILFISFSKKGLSKLLNSLGNLAFLTLLCLNLEIQKFYYIILLIPLVVFSAFSLLLNCHSERPRFDFILKFSLLSRWSAVLAFLFISLKVDGFVDWSWYGILWPIWVLICCSYVISAFSFGLALGYLCSCMYNSSHFSDFISYFWLFFNTCGLSSSLTYTITRLISQETEFVFIYLIIFLLLAVVLTFASIKSIVSWWLSSINEQDLYSIPSNDPSSPSILRYTRVTQTRLVKLPPPVLKRVTSTYFLPVLDRKKITKALSSDLEDQKDQQHIRNFSSPCLDKATNLHSATPSDASFINKKCGICFENECDAVIMDCGHGGICLNCAQVLTDSVKKCHMCRAEIVQILKIRIGKKKLTEVIGVK